MIVVTFTSDFFLLKYGLPSSWYPILPRFRRSWRHLMISDGLISPVSLMMSMMTVRHSVGRRFRGWKNFRSEPREVMPKRTCTRQKHTPFHSMLLSFFKYKWKQNYRIPVNVFVDRHDSNILYILYGLHFIIFVNDHIWMQIKLIINFCQ